jgi:hypothetical protein
MEIKRGVKDTQTDREGNNKKRERMIKRGDNIDR